MTRYAVAVLCALLITAGCTAGGNDASGAAHAATSFHDAIAAGDGETACALLTDQALHKVEESSGSPCEQGVLDAGITDAGASQGTEVYGTEGHVDFATDTVFVTRQRAGWRVAAAGCHPQSAEPYDCLLEG